MSITITHAKIIKGKSDVKHLSVSFLRSLSDGKKASCEEEFPNEIHEDLKNAFGGLDVHLALINEFIDNKQFDEIEEIKEELFSDFHVGSFSYGGSDESPSIVISGHKILSTGKAFNFNTVSTKLDEDEENAYNFLDNLKKRLALIKVEIQEYMNGKHAPEMVNGTLDFPEDEGKVTHMQIAKEETPESKLQEKIDRKNNRAAANKKAMPVKSLVKKSAKKKK